MKRAVHLASGYCKQPLLTDGKLCLNKASRDGYCLHHHPVLHEARRGGASRAEYDRAAGAACRKLGIVDPTRELPAIIGRELKKGEV